MKYAFVIMMCIGVGACQSTPSAGEESVSLPDHLPEGFTDFYQRFLTDSLYQMEHILFPLQGLPDKADSTTLTSNTFRWEMKDWVLHRPIPPSSDFSVDLQLITETMVRERIRHASGQYAMERRYAYLDDGWYLIYYAGLNAIE